MDRGQAGGQAVENFAGELGITRRIGCADQRRGLVENQGMFRWKTLSTSLGYGVDKL
jgi:hypothetical protein